MSVRCVQLPVVSLLLATFSIGCSAAAEPPRCSADEVLDDSDDGDDR